MKTNTSSIDDRRQFFLADFQYLSKALPGAAFKVMRSILQYISSSAEMLLKYRGKLSVQRNSYSKITPKLCHMIPLVIHRAPPTLRQCGVASQRARKRWSDRQLRGELSIGNKPVTLDEPVIAVPPLHQVATPRVT